MSRFPGNIIKLPNVTPTQSSAQGVWSLKDQLVYQRNNQWPFQRDPYFNYTTLLLQGNVPNTTGPQAMTQPLAYNSDASTNNFLVTPNGEVSPRPFSPYGGGAYSNFFDGSGDYLTATNSSAFYLSTGNFTVEAWLYKSASGTGIIVGQTQNSGAPYNGWLMYVTSGNLIRFEGSNGVSIQSTGTFPLNQWVHVAAVRVGSTTTLYMDGSAVGTGSVSITDFSGVLTIGQYTTPVGGSEWNGYISNLRIVKGTAVYTSNFTPPTQPLQNITNTSLLTCQSNRFIDNGTANSGSGFAITANGTPRVTDNSPFVSTDFTTGAGYFDGGTDFLQVANNAAFGSLNGVDYTIEFWAYLTTLSGDQPLLACTAIGASGFAVWSLSGQLNTLFGGGTTITGATLTANQWNHIAIVRTSTNTQLYLNGATQGTPSTSAFVNNTSQPLMVGGLTSGTGWNSDRYVTGYISGLRIIKSQALATGNFTPPTTLPTTATVGWTGGNVPTQSITGTVSILTLQTRAASQNIGFIDSSPNEFIVTKNGNTTQGTFSPFSPTGWGNYFNGSNAYLNTATSADFAFGTGNFQIEFFFFAQTTGQQRLVFFTVTDANQISMGVFNNYEVTYYDGTNTRTIGTVTAGTWNHVAVAKTSGAVTCWLNGTRTVNALTDNSNTSSNRAVYLGATNSGTNILTGYMSNVSIIKGSTTYSGASIPVPTSPLTAVSGTVLLTCQSNRFLDQTGKTITVTGSPSVQAFSPFAPATQSSPLVTGGSGYFDGVSDYLNGPTNTASSFNLTGDFTIECWAYFTSVSTAGQGLVTWADSGGWNGWQFINDAGTIKFEFLAASSAAATVTGGTVVNNQWYHLAVVRNGSGSNNVVIYINGSSSGSPTTYTGTQGTSASSFFRVGVDRTATNEVVGYISGARVVNGTAVYSGTNFPIPTAPPTAIPNTSLLLNFTGGGIVDATGKNNLETVGKAQLSTVQPKWVGSGSLQFDGSGYLAYRNNSVNAFGTGDYTIEFWVYHTSLSGQQTYFSDGFGASSGPYVYKDSSNLIGLYYSSQILTASSAISVNTWYHVAFVRQSGTVKLYIDGVQKASNPDTTNLTSPIQYVGNDGSSGAFLGYMTARLTNFARYTGSSTSTANFTLPTGPFPIG